MDSAGATLATLHPEGSQRAGSWTYQARHWAAPGASVSFAASAADADALFEPAAASATAAAAACIAGKAAAEFRSRKGVVISGRVRPAIKGVEVSIARRGSRC